MATIISQRDELKKNLDDSICLALIATVVMIPALSCLVIGKYLLSVALMCVVMMIALAMMTLDVKLYKSASSELKDGFGRIIFFKYLINERLFKRHDIKGITYEI